MKVGKKEHLMEIFKRVFFCFVLKNMEIVSLFLSLLYFYFSDCC